MKSKKSDNFLKAVVQKTPIKTSFMEILDELTRLTKDDAVVLAIDQLTVTLEYQKQRKILVLER